jgi:DNA-binding transcriptional regulator YhcF (GntR family)
LAEDESEHMRTWIKLYTEILSDPKMGRMTDRQYRTCINLFLIGGQVDNDGELASTDDIAWKLRMDAAAVSDDLAELAKLGIVEDRDGIWYVTKWQKRQAKPPSAENEEVAKRVREHRERKRQREGNEDVTSLHDDVTSDVTTLEKIREEKNREDGANHADAWDEIAGLPRPAQPAVTTGRDYFLKAFGAKKFKTAIQGQTVDRLEAEHGIERLKEVIDWAAKRGMSVSDAVVSVESAIATWGQPKPGRNGHVVPTGDRTRTAAMYTGSEK